MQHLEVFEGLHLILRRWIMCSTSKLRRIKFNPSNVDCMQSFQVLKDHIYSFEGLNACAKSLEGFEGLHLILQVWIVRNPSKV